MTVESRAELSRKWSRQRARQLLLIGLGLLALASAMALSVSLGVSVMRPGVVVRALLSPLLPAAWYADIPAVQIAVLYNLRLPRAVMAIIGGAALAAAGVSMQGISRNPLVSPYTLGISPAAAFGASLAILSGVAAHPATGRFWMVGAAFVSALTCAGLVVGLSALRGVTSTVLILAGVGLTYLFSALTATIQFVATEQQLAAIIQWTFGSLNGRTWDEVAIAGAIVAVSLPVLQAHAPALDALATGGDEVATSLGFAVARTRLLITIAAVLATAAIVSFTGVIAFVGLVAPHIARMLIGGSHRVLIPFAAIIGALLLLIADLIGRLAFAPVIIPVGIVVAYLGVPLFLHLLLSRRQEMLV
jgi:iron complex transport system permease protein